jgi:hydroxymethylglutaryl-CoA reductase (NADPH)
MASLEELAKRLEPVDPESRPLPPDVPHPGDWSASARDDRLESLRAQGFDLAHLAGRGPALDPAHLQGNIEQYIGMTQVPTGVIGPLRINGVSARGDFYVPLATTEGTLVASYHRGARLAALAGGISALVTTEHVQRAPAFLFSSLVDAARFAAWVTASFDRFREVAATRTRHGRLLDLLVHLEANHVYLIFTFHTGDAAGQNMVTSCTAAICDDIVERTPVPPQSWYLEAILSGDK